MATSPFLGQLATFGFGIVPKGWAACNGQLLPISQNQALFSLLGTTYGGDGRTTFGLPNLQGSFMNHVGSGFVQGQVGGEVVHTLTVAEMAAHNHPMLGSSAVAPKPPLTPVGNFPAVTGSPAYAASGNTTLGSGSSPGGGGQPHANMPPYLVINVCIALQGIFPSRN